MKHVEVNSLSELPQVAEQLLGFAGEEKVFCFFGEMGAGKTTLIKEICSLLKVEDVASSPTFSIINEYRSAAGRKIYHFDFYRLKDEEEALDLGVEEYFSSGNYCFIEWPEKILNLLPLSYVRVDIAGSKTNRSIRFQRHEQHA